MRPKRCAVCRKDATYVEVEVRPEAVIKLDGSVHRFKEQHNVFFCQDHTGVGGGHGQAFQ